MMLLNIFNYLSDGHAPLVEDLWPPKVSTKLLVWVKIAPPYALGKIFIFFLLDLPEAKKAPFDPLTARQSLLGSKALSFVKIEYLRISGALCPALSFQVFLRYFRFR